MASLEARVDNDLRAAIQALQNTLSKDVQADIQQTSFPRFENLNDVDQNAAELEDAIDKLINLRSHQKLHPQGSKRAKEYLRKWYMASYPFARIFVTTASQASAVYLW